MKRFQKMESRWGLMNREVKLRELLWLHHGCPVHYLYGDDGELQCNNKIHGLFGIDFRRDSEEIIGWKLCPPEVRSQVPMPREVVVR